jgi:hypothetical protein
MRDNQSTAPLKRRFSSPFEQPRPSTPSLGRGLVKNHDRRISEHNPSQRQLLRLRSSKPMPALANNGRQPVGQSLNPLQGPHFPQSGGEFIIRTISLGKPQVIGKRASKHMNFLRNKHNGPPHRRNSQFPKTHPTKPNIPTGRRVNASDQLGKRRLPSPTGPDKRNPFPRPNFEVNAMQNVFPSTVSMRNPNNTDRSIKGHRRSIRLHWSRRLSHSNKPRKTGHSGLRIVDERQGNIDRVEQPMKIQRRSGGGTNRHIPATHQQKPHGEHSPKPNKLSKVEPPVKASPQPSGPQSNINSSPRFPTNKPKMVIDKPKRTNGSPSTNSVKQLV